MHRRIPDSLRGQDGPQGTRNVRRDARRHFAAAVSGAGDHVGDIEPNLRFGENRLFRGIIISFLRSFISALNELY